MTTPARPRTFIWEIVKRYPGRTVLLVVLLVLSGIAESVGIAAVLPLLELLGGGDTVSDSGVSRFLSRFMTSLGIPVRAESALGLISAAMILKGALRLLAMRQVGYTVARVGTDLRLDFIDALFRTRWSYFVHQPTGRFAHAVGVEAIRASTAYQHVCGLFAVVTQILFYAAISFLVSWSTALMALLAGALVLALRTPLVRSARAASRDQNELLQSITARLVDALNGIKSIKAMGREKHLRPVLELETLELNRAQERQVLAVEVVGSTREPLLVLLLSGMLYAMLALTEASLPSLLVVAFLFTRLAGRIVQAQWLYQEVTLGEAAYRSIQDSIVVAAAEREPEGGGLPSPPLEEAITFCEVSFAYTDRNVLDGVSLLIPARSFVALVGPSGAGKTTVADLAAGLLTPTGGEILVDGTSLTRIRSSAWREGIGYVPQDALLLHSSVLENVVLGDTKISRRRVEEALEAAGALDFVLALPEGLDTRLGERGTRLSGGQRQRIAIARALVREPRLLILDEVTSSLDPRSEAALCTTFRELHGQVTILAISHQPAIATMADLVYRVEDGRVELITLGNRSGNALSGVL